MGTAVARGNRHRAGGVVAALVIVGVVGCSGPSGAPTSPAGSTPSVSGSTTGAAPTPRPPETPAPAPTVTPSSAPSPTTPTPALPPPTAASPAPPESPVAIPDSWRGIDVTRLPTTLPVVALTFDAGASDAGVRPILDTLARYDVAATFFVTGAFARAYPDAVRAITAAGHPIGNHSDTHPDFTVTTTAEIQAQLAAAERAIVALTGRPAAPLFRFPYGARTTLDIQVVNAAGYIPFRWTVDTLGWKGTSGGIDAATVIRRVLDTAQPGQIVLMHVGANPTDGTTLDADALPRVIEELSARGFGFVDLREMLP
ncbi:MAG TPA: polysaccharide deacetylase family protein [Cellulomonadaceae bacterium]|nr:polysaccharide deacetylase family protein [Cellulomonadaceae bacterium]